MITEVIQAQEKTLEQITKEVEIYVKSFQIEPVTSEEDMARYLNIAKIVKDKTKSLEEKCKSEVAGLKKQTKEKEQKYAVPIQLWKSFELSLKAQMQIYHDKKEAEALERLKAQQAENERIQAEQAEKNDGIVDVIPTPIVEAPKSSVKTDLATASFKKPWDAEVEDAVLVPLEYMMVNPENIHHAILQGIIPREFLIPNEKAIKSSVVSDGVRSIAGVRIFQKTQIAIR